jgi:hypothetical protein
MRVCKDIVYLQRDLDMYAHTHTHTHTHTRPDQNESVSSWSNVCSHLNYYIKVSKHLSLSQNIEERAYAPTASVWLVSTDTSHVMQWQIGHNITIRGPRGPFRYLGRGKFKIGEDSAVRSAEAIGFVCGGSGITPAYQVLCICMYACACVCMWMRWWERNNTCLSGAVHMHVCMSVCV